MILAAVSSTGKTPLTWDVVLAPHMYVFCAAWLVSFIFTPIMQAIANYYGIIDQPDRVRKLHVAPVAYLGGVAVFMGWLVGLATSQLHLPQDEIGSPHLQVRLNIVIGAILIVLLGLWDDVKRIRPRNKILGQAIVAMILLKGGVGTHCLNPLFDPINQRLGTLLHVQTVIPAALVDVLSWGFVVALVIGCCNATNLLDGLDGLCGGVTAVIAAGFLFLAVQLAMLTLEPDWDAIRIVLALSLLGAILGFVPYNFNPASIFLGDTGSMFIGYSCATIIVLLAQEQAKWLLAALVMFALPILDTALAFARRWVNRRPLFSPDRHHFHHQLVDRGFSIRQTVLISYALAIVFILLGMMVAYLRTRYAVSFYLTIFGSLIVAAYKMGLVHEKARVVTPRTLGSSDALVPVTSSQQAAAVVELRGATNGAEEATVSEPGPPSTPAQSTAPVGDAVP